ncbi:MAG: hypothetical protein K0R14_1492 [Burkholderiales bacterium]|jgi:hypothetical protein|nr:hypothetical protein [Burkholderiales bacterium]
MPTTGKANLSSTITPGVRNESEVLSVYTGVVGTAPKNDTISNAGAAFELLPNGTNVYGFFSQTLSNDIYYEARLYGRYNYIATNPNIPGIPTSNQNPPPGYGLTGILGYNFHPTDLINLTPYVRANGQYNMGPVYNDTNGDYLHSTTYGLFVGGKLTFKATPIFSPYVNLWGGYQVNDLVGSYPNSATKSNVPISGVLNQTVVIYEIGIGAKLSEHISLIPYWQYITNANSPNAAASTALDQGGLNQTNLTGTAQVFALKLNVAW